MAESAWVNFYCATDERVRVATFRRAGEEWQLVEVGADVLPEGGAMPGRIAMTGGFGFGGGYAGCPGCGADSYARCNDCGELGCWRSASTHTTCAHCGRYIRITGSIESLGAMDVA